ncbi:MAG TPA: hypothetical protein ENI26_02095 [Methylophaga aminisulfidivorans]|uniref:Uncharacterized protein n=2 Tax=root TaxID=1 RepID=A0A7C1ZQE5_9GAMM|nr:hypothetical protein [Methylophaga aminisulfidivorans]
MRVSYFAHCLRNIESGENVKFDLGSFASAFCKFENPIFKNTFTHNGENVYLLHNSGDVYLFIMTKSNEVIRKINTDNLSVSEINDLLAKDEQLGFASYILIKENHFGYSSTLMAPRIDCFNDFIEFLLSKIGVKDYQFRTQALLYQATKADVLSMNYLGRTTIDLAKHSNVVKNFLSELNVTDADILELDGIEIKIKPKQRKNIKPVVDKVIQNLPDDGVEKMIVKAKHQDAGEALKDLYLIGQGSISDSIDKSKEAKIPDHLESKRKQNKIVDERLAEYIEHEQLTEKNIEVVQRFSDAESWSARFPMLSNTD